MNENRNIWKELRNLGFLPSPKSSLHGLTPEELNCHFSNISISFSEDHSELIKDDIYGYDDGFAYSPVTTNDVIQVVAHFKSQTKGEDEIPQSVIAKAFPFIGLYLTNLFKKALILALKKVPVTSFP